MHLYVQLKWISLFGNVSTHPACFLNAFSKQHCWAFSTSPPFCSDLSQFINRGPFYLLGKQVVMIVSQYTYDEMVSASMCFLFGMLHLLTQVWEGRSRYFWLRLHATQNTTTHSCSAVSGHSTVRAMCHFDLIPWRGCYCTDSHMADWSNIKKHITEACDCVKVITQLSARQ